MQIPTELIKLASDECKMSVDLFLITKLFVLMELMVDKGYF